MRYTRIITDEQGETHFVDGSLELVDREFAPPARPLSVSEPIAATAAVMFSVPADWYGEAHPAPARQWCFVLTGSIRAQASDGEERTWGPGGVILLEDTDGKGHVTWAGPEGASGVFVQAPV